MHVKYIRILHFELVTEICLKELQRINNRHSITSMSLMFMTVAIDEMIASTLNIVLKDFIKVQGLSKGVSINKEPVSLI